MYYNHTVLIHSTSLSIISRESEVYRLWIERIPISVLPSVVWWDDALLISTIRCIMHPLPYPALSLKNKDTKEKHGDSSLISEARPAERNKKRVNNILRRKKKSRTKFMPLIRRNMHYIRARGRWIKHEQYFLHKIWSSAMVVFILN